MDNFERCLEDIEAALQFGYPDNMRFKLLDRQENIFNTDHELKLNKDGGITHIQSAPQKLF